MLRAEIIGVGSYVPERVLTNFDMEKFLDTSDEWIRKRTGIEQRHWAAVGQSTSDLALQASQDALKSAGLSATDLDMIIFATLTPDHFFPGTGCFLQEKLGVAGIATLDIRQQCTGFLYGLSIADHFIRCGTYKKILLVGSEVHSSGLDRTTRGRDVTVLFGDGSGAVILSAKEVRNPEKDSFVLGGELHADGRGAKELWVPAPGSALGRADRVDHEVLEAGLHYPQMNGKKVFIAAVTKMAESLTNCLEEHGVTVQDVDRFFFHQANLRINDAVAEQLSIPREKVFNTIQKFGNTTAATIPLGMHEALKAGELKKGMLVALAAFGSGYTWGASLLRY
ncbi:MAG: ketoacyl-ACP synthase III [Bdellovibrionales bacterium]|nr:ketoacyl-ACP synthase III [Bdellovibrionales bacterium]